MWLSNGGGGLVGSSGGGFGRFTSEPVISRLPLSSRRP